MPDPVTIGALAASALGMAGEAFDHASLGSSLHQVGYCLSSTGDFAAARPWFERAVSRRPISPAASRRPSTSGRPFLIAVNVDRHLGD
jgi:hypothetical protein